MTIAHRDHTVCGICDVSFYVARRFKKGDGKVQTTNLGNKSSTTAYKEARISHDEMKDNGQVQVLVKKPLAEVIPMADGYELSESRWQDEKHFLTNPFPIARDHNGTTCFTNLDSDSRYGIRKIKMCSHETGPCAEAYDPKNPIHAVGVPFHLHCLEMFRRVSIHKNGKIVWAGLYEMGMQKNHAGLQQFEKDPDCEINHQYNAMARENNWVHEQGTEWVVADPIAPGQFSIHSCFYTPPMTGPNPREQVFSSDYRLAVGSIGPHAWRYWGPRVASWKQKLDLKANKHSTSGKKNIDIFVQKKKNKPRLLTLPRPPNVVGGVAGPPNAPRDPPAVLTASSSSSSISLSTEQPRPAPPPSSPPDNNFLSTLPQRPLLKILSYLPPLSVANLRLTCRHFASIPNTHFRDRIARDMPWSWEVIIQEDGRNGLIGPPPGSGLMVDYKEMYRIVRGMGSDGVGGVKGVRNRRRIWGRCEGILEGKGE